MNVRLQLIAAHLLANWKTTAQSLLVGVIGLGAVAPKISWLKPHQAATLVSVGVIAHVILGIFQKDAGSEVVKGQTGPTVVPSHEVPDNTVSEVVK